MLPKKEDKDDIPEPKALNYTHKYQPSNIEQIIFEGLRNQLEKQK